MKGVFLMEKVRLEAKLRNKTGKEYARKLRKKEILNFLKKQNQVELAQKILNLKIMQ